MDILEFTRKKVAELTGNTEQETAHSQTKYSKDEEKELALDLIREKRSEQAYASVGENFFTDLQRDLQGLSVPAVGNVPKTTGGYYSRPVVDTSGVEDIQKRLESLSDVMQQVSYPVEKAERRVKAAATNLETVGATLKSAYDIYTASPTQEAAQAYNQALSTYRTAKVGYDTAYKAYTTAYEQYRKVAEEANSVFSAWQKYVGDSQAEYDAWKSTIRDAATIQQEIDAINAQLDEMAKNGKRGNSTGIVFVDDAMDWVQDQLGIRTAADITSGEYEIKRLQAKRQLLQEELDWAKYYYYTGLENAADFASESVYDPQDYHARSNVDIILNNYANAPWEDPLYEYINGNQEAGAYISNAAANNYGSGSLSSIYGRVAEGKQESQQMTKAEVQIFNYLYATQGKVAAHEYYNYLLQDLNYRQRQEDEKYWKEYAANDPFGASVFSVAMSPLKGLSYLGQTADYLTTGEIDQNASYNKFSYTNSAIRSQVAEKIEKKWGGVGSFAYQTGMSMFDFLTNAAISGGNSVLSMAIMGSGAAADTTIAAKDRGLSDDQAFALGTIAGAAEAVTERFSLEALLKPGMSKTAISYILKNALVEGSEEGASTLINTMADIIISKDKSEWALSIKEYQDMGKSEGEAFGLAVSDQAAALGLDILGGMISGGIVGTGGSIVNKNEFNNMGQKLGLGDVTLEQAQEIINSGLESAVDTDAYQMALKLQEKINAGKVPTKGELAQQLMANEQAIRAEQTTGENDNVGIKEQLKASENVLSGMEPVANITTPSNFAEMDLNAKKNWVIEKLRPTGYSVERKGFGIINFAQKKLRAAFNYFKKGSADEAAFEALPYVLEKGIEISSRENHKGRKYSTVTFAAPVTINGQRGNMAVVVRQAQGNQYKVHRVLLPDGSAFYISETENEAESSTTRGVADTGSLASSKDTASTDIIDQGGGIVNTYNQNGGTENASTYGQADTPSTGAGAGVLHGSSQRNVGAGAGEQTGGLDSGAETAAQRTERITGASRIKSAVARQNLARSLRLPKVSAQDIGLTKGTERRNLQVLPQEHWDGELQALAQKIQDETGKEPVFVIGDIHVQGADNQSHRIRAAITAEQVILQADYTKVSLDQILDHEIYHYKAAFVRENNHNLNNMNKLSILEQFSKEELQAVLDAYIAALDGQYGLSEAVEQNDKEAYRQILALIREEMMADAYAGINAFGAGADKFTKAVNDRMDGLNLGKKTAQENGVRQTNGPNENTAHMDGERYSLCEFEDGTRYVDVQMDAHTFDGMSVAEMNRTAKQILMQKFAGKVIGVDNQVFVNGDSVNEYLHPSKAISADIRKAKLTASGELDNLLDAGKTLPNQPDGMDGHIHPEVTDFSYLRTIFKVGKEYFEGIVNIKNIKRGRLLKDVTKIRNITKDIVSSYGTNPKSNFLRDASMDSIRYSSEDVNQKYFDAVSYGDMQTAQQMVDEAARAAGYTIKAYHGTSNEFTTFERGNKRTRGRLNFGDGFYFSPDRSMAENYTNTGRVIEGYLKLENPRTVYGTQLDRSDFIHLSNVSGREVTHDNVTEVLREMGHDGIIGRSYNGTTNPVNQYVIFDAEQVKSADPVTYDDKGNVIPLSERFNAENKDIRYSTDDEGVEIIKSDKRYLMDEEEFHRVKGDLESRRAEWEKMYLYDQLGPEGEKRYKATQQVENTRKKAEQAQRAKENRIQPGKVELDVESRATEAKRLLENKLLQTFSIPDGLRGELRAYIGGFADRIVKHGALTEDDRRRFFARMYESGAVTIPADDYYGEARSYIKGGHIYVPSNVVAEFGDDWQDIRRRAFGAGIYLTYERTDKNGHSISGIDVWNSDLAADLPGLFDAEDTDEAAILQKIIHVAEQGKEEKISLAEYVTRVAKEEYTSEDDVLDSLERQMRWALESFAETAKVEIQLKDRNLRRVMKERAENQERAQRAKERRELQELQQKTLKSLQWLNKNRRLAPEELREEWNRALSDIDLYAVGAANEMNWSNKYQATWKDLAEMYKEARAKDPNFHEDAEIERIISRLDNKKIADMDPAALLDLYKLATGLRTAFYNRNNVLNDEQYRIFEEVYLDSKEELTEAGKGKEGLVDRFLNREQLSAMNVLERMAGWNPNSAWYSMAKQLERGERDVRAFTVKANRILEDYLNEHKDFVMRADGQGKDAIWYTIEVPELMEWGKGNKPIFGDTVTVYMTPAQKVHMYLESKNLDNLRHMEGGRTFVVDKDLYGKGKRQEALKQGRTIRLAPETVKQLVSNLTEEEMELAQVLDQYYNGFATGEINRVSNVLYGYDKAMGKHYAPIYTNQNYTNAEFGRFDYTAEGVGNMKGRVEYSKNPSYNISAFDAFERNVNQTARFVGMAIPIRNWNTLINWQERNSSMKDVIDHAWTPEYQDYIGDLLKDLQGEIPEKQTLASRLVEKMQSNYISSVFGANMSIVLKQMGSIPLAGAYLGVGNVVPGRAQVERLDRDLIGKYTQDLAWRGMGYSMPETKQLKDHPNWTQNNKIVRFAIGGGAITAMDQWAASVLWPWAENKVRKEYPELEVGTKEQVNNGDSPFYKKVAEEFENAVARSQSTSDQMHQGTMRKSKHPVNKMLTMFKSDSAQNYNTLRQTFGEMMYYARSGQETKWKNAYKSLGVGVVAMLLNALWGASVNLLVALIKNKGKKYLDEEGEFTDDSIVRMMLEEMFNSMAGTLAGCEELAELIGSSFVQEKYYAPESLLVSVLQDALNLMHTIFSDLKNTCDDIAEIKNSGGDIGQYLREHGNDILGQVKSTATETATLFGIPAANVEAYIVGALKFIPGFGAVYDGWFESADKNALGGLTGENLSIRVGSLLDQRGIDASDETADALAELYEAGHTGAIPGETPSKVSIDGEERTLNAGQMQLYGHVWADIVESALDEVVSSDRFAEASLEIRERMLKKLYSYAAEQAKTRLFDDFEPSGTKEDIAAYVAAGLGVADYLAVKAEGHNTDKYLEAVVHGLPEDNADDLMDEIAELEPMAGEDKVADVQKWRTCVDAFGVPMYQLAALASYMTDTQFKKARAADDFGVDLKNFVKLYEIRAEYDENGNKSFSNAEYKKAIDSLRLSTQDSAVLWQLFTGAKSAKNNPYSSEIGQKVIDTLAD